MSRYLVTGAAGFIGSHLCEILIADGHEVLGIDRFSPHYARDDKEENLAGLRRESAFEFRELDLAAGGLEGIASDVEGVYHLAAQAGVRASWGKEFSVYIEDNIHATQRLLEAFCGKEIEGFVFASSSSIYGDAETAPTPEDTIPRPVSPYGVSKLAGEHLCGLYHRNHGVPTVSLRYFTVYGPRQRPDMAFHKFLAAGIRGEAITLYGDGGQSRDFTYVKDAAEATRAALRKGKRGGVYNIGGGQRASVNEVIACMEEIQGAPMKIGRMDTQMGDVRHTWADTKKAQSDLDFSPKTQLSDGLRAEYEWLLGREKK
ncbi:MAG: NAD-dependent epimerase/dehydratase family protein [bacterium]|nr:NAD-dependent epimerase/dehydratase family protein [bacterium]